MTDEPTEDASAAPRQAGVPDQRPVSWRVTLLACLVIAAVAAGLAALIFSTEPTAEREGASKKTAMLVEVKRPQRGAFRPRIVATGTVEPTRDVTLNPQVGGRVLELGPNFVPGGFVEKGDVLVRIESADYRNALAQRESELRLALSDLALEQGRQDAARAEYAYLGEELPAENKALVLRQPQLEAARERVDAARAAVEQARLDIARTTVEAPFDAHIISREVNVGSQVSPDAALGRLVGIDEYWVAIELPLSKLRWIEVGDDGESGSLVRVRNPRGWPAGVYRDGVLSRLVGALDEDTRMARLLATVPDPLSRSADARDVPPLIIGEFVEATIEGVEIPDVVRVPRDWVRDQDTVWVMEEGALQVREVDVVLRDAEHAYLAGGIDEHDDVVVTNLAVVIEGAPLRLAGSESRERSHDAGLSGE